MADNVQETDDEKLAAGAEKPRVSPNLLVAAIDFGTAYSGYAFSSRGDFTTNPLKISAHEWNKDLISHKTPTSVLLNKDKELDSFGDEAEKKFMELSEDEKHRDYYFFRKFKMLLYNTKDMGKRLTKKTLLFDINGKEMPAIDVFAIAIKYMKSHLLKELETKAEGCIRAEEIRWVLTVPAIWNDPAKQFMRDAAEKADIRGDCLTIALEPEAASIYCKHLPIEQIQTVGRKDFGMFHPGSRYLVLDAGGGTVDITIHEVLQSGKIKEIEKASGGAWGGTYVDKAFHEIMEKIVGKELYNQYKTEHLADFLEMCQALELKKRTITTKSSSATFKIPASLKEICKSEHKSKFEDLAANSKYANILVCKRDKLEFKEFCVHELFSQVCDGIVKHVNKLLEKPQCRNIENILMVGGFSESPYLQETIKRAFPNFRIVIPNEAGLAVLKGAVLYGHEPQTVTSRIAKYTYGVDTLSRFKKGVHPPNKLHMVDGTEYCSDVFSKHITKGDELNINETQDEQTYYPVREKQKAILFNVYTSTNKNPRYTDDPDCSYLGSMTVDIPDTTGGTNRKVLVRFIFGGTEIKVEGKNDQTGEITAIKFNFFESGPEQDEEYSGMRTGIEER
ncbi:heat shock 70 kDa protein 12B-like [Saccostrea echinata]|uniref:heat shock 70 kDa protein 12B-like n=1 Tax=Saccostrea echinata TaxID=191078 RepID=UPI002A83FBB6|nr:heat shock 70 kDa protein 12B-like [Saccostrea echinata]